ncbi:MAG: tripartite tricarboxylate transporter TctB family protein [Rhodobacteraceae bacterium]|nr:tripartite tricarboxylate transporter TctB family protein [Paracoccaceae bacterium]
MNMQQHRISSGVITLLAIWVCYLSFTERPAEAYLFPRIIAVFFLAFAIWTFGKALLGRSNTGVGLSYDMAVKMAPGLLVSVIYIFWAAKAFGFYTASTLTFFILVSIYDPAPHGKIGSWVKRAVITVGFIAVIYALFAVVLKVYTPRGMFL